MTKLLYFATIQFRTIKYGLVFQKGIFMYFFKKTVPVLFPAIAVAFSGCNSTVSTLAASAGEKNLDLSGYVMLGKLETVNPNTASPAGKLIIGRVNYKSRLVALDKNKQVPNTGAFRATRTVSLFGTQETIIEYDFTASGADAAGKICRALEQQKTAAETQFADKTEYPPINI